MAVDIADDSTIAGSGRVNVFVAVGVVWVIAGGLVAAVTGPLRLEHGSWAAAYQVLVAGVTQSALGLSQEALAPRRLSPRTVAGELTAWNLGSAAVLGGTLAHAPLVVGAGGISLLITLVLMIRAVRGGTDPAWALWTYRAILTVILISIPIGLTLAHLRAY